jgi:ATP-binding cassette subfamily F protein uup
MTIPLVSLQGATKAYSDKPLFADLTCVISEQERVALIGNNGCGKSTLLKALAGQVELDSGRVHMQKGTRCAYVSQDDTFPAGISAVDAVDAHLLQKGFEHDEIARRSSMYLGLAGFDDLHVLVSTLSGGWRKRLSLVCALAEEPECLLLDEPTNHLDIESIEWLEEIIAGLSCAVVFISHDRYFIERVASRVIEINTSYPRHHLASEGGYADYIEHREELLGQLKQQRDSLANKVRREVEWLRQGVKARTTKSRARINEAHRLIDKLQGSAIAQRSSMELEFATTQRKTKELLKAERIAQSINGTQLFSDVSLILSPGSRLAIVGPNGSGKTTLVRTLLGELPPSAGRIVKAPNLQVSLMDQARSQIREGTTLREFLCPHGDSIVFCGESIHVAAWAARFLFSHNHLARDLSALSGGEKARAILAKSIAQQADILVFDEPTNDLDIATLENLEDGFESFPGAIVLITHDRYLLDRTASRVLGLSEGRATMFGSYAQWEEYRAEHPKAAKARDTASRVATDAAKEHNTAPNTKGSKRLSYKDARDLGMIEKLIEKAEALVEETQRQIDSGEHATNASKLAELCEALTEQQCEVERLYARWQELETLKGADQG